MRATARSAIPKIRRACVAMGLVFFSSHCGPGSKDDGTAFTNIPTYDSTTTTTLPTTETGETAACEEYGKMTMDLYFGWDGAQTRSYFVEGQELPSTFVVNVGIATWDGDPATTDAYCSIAFVIDGKSKPFFATNEGFWWGAEDIDPYDYVTDCYDFPWCPGEFAVGPVEEYTVNSWAWAFGGDIDEEVDQYFGPYLIPAENFWGAIVRTDLVAGETLGQPGDLAIVGQGFQVDAGWEVDTNAPITKDEAGLTGSLPAGYYVGFIPWLFTMI